MIYHGAFCNCSNLTEIRINSNSETIGQLAFTSTGITVMDIPKGVKEISNYAFFHVENLHTLYIEETVTYIGDYCFHECYKLKTVNYLGLKEPKFGKKPFYGLQAGPIYVLPDYVSTTGKFGEMSLQKSLNIYKCGDALSTYWNTYSKTLTIHGRGEMYDNPERPWASKKDIIIENIFIDENVNTISSNFFSNLNIESAVLPNKIYEVGDCLFMECKYLTNITLSNRMIEIPSRCFAFCSNLESIIIPNSVRYFTDSPFCGCIKLKSIIHNETYTIDDVWYYGVQKNRELIFYPPWNTQTHYEMPDNVVNIDKYAFVNCKSLQTLTISNLKTSIGCNAFENCTSLISINIPDKVTYIEQYAFYGCSQLTNIEIGSGVYSIGLHAFDGCKNVSSCIYHGVLDPSAEGTTFQYTTYLYYVTVRMNYESRLFLGVIAQKSFEYGDIGEKLKFNYKNSTNTLKIYGSGYMNNFSKTNRPWEKYFGFIKTVTIDEGVLSIGDYAFYNCKMLTQINIPASLNSIGYGSFYFCTSLLTFNISENNTAFVTTDNILYTYDTKCLLFYPPQLTNYSVNISKQVTSINDMAFSNCKNIKELVLEKDIKYIGNSSFADCTNLQKLNFLGAIEPSISEDSFLNTKIKEVRVSAKYENTSFGPFPITKVFDEGECGKDVKWYYNIETSKLTIYGSGDTYNYSLTDMPTWEPYKNSIKEVEIDEGVTSIGNFLLANCGQLKQIKIPASLNSFGIGPFAFSNMISYFNIHRNNIYFDTDGYHLYSYDHTSLILYFKNNPGETLNIKDPIKSIREYAISNKSSITTLIIEGDIEHINDCAFYNCTNLKSIFYIGYTEPIISNTSFTLCENITEVRAQLKYEHDKWGNFDIIKDFQCGKFTSGAYWLYNSTNNTLIFDGSNAIDDFPNSSAVPWAEYHNSIKEVQIGNSISKIGAYSLTGCSLITSIYIPKNTNNINNLCWPLHSKFKSFEVESTSNYFTSKNGVLYSKSLNIIKRFPSGKENTTFEIDSETEYIDNYCFMNCSYLTTIIIPTTVTNFGQMAFCNCPNLVSMTYYGTSQPENSIVLFDGSNNLKEVLVSFKYPNTTFEQIPVKKCFDNGLTEYYTYSFDNINGSGILILKERNLHFYYPIPWSLYQDLIKHVIIEKNVTSIIDNIFVEFNNLISITISETVKEIGKTPFPPSLTFKSINVNENNAYIKSVDGVLYSKNESFLICYPPGKNDTSFEINENVLAINDAAFKGSFNLESVTIGPNVTYIGNQSFWQCPNIKSVTYYGIKEPYVSSAFDYCDKLKYVNVLPLYRSLKFGNLSINRMFPSTSVPDNSSQIPSTEKPINPNPIITPTPVPEIITNLYVPENTDSEELDKILNETFDKLSSDQNANKVIIIDSREINFKSDLDKNQFIKPKEDSRINYINGNLNLILPDSGKVNVNIQQNIVNISINGEGELNIRKDTIGLNPVIVLEGNSQINGSVKISVPRDTEIFTINSIDFKNEGSIELQNDDDKPVKFNIEDISTTYNANASISNVNVLKSINVIQTSTLNLNNVTLDDAVINIEIIDFANDKNTWNPFFKGNFYSSPQKVVLTKSSNDQKRPINDYDYTLATGLFEENMCESWLKHLEYGNSGFTSKNCENNLLAAENKRIVLKNVEDNKGKNGGKMSGGQIAGIVIGVIAGIAIIVIAVFCIIKHKNKNTRSESQDANDDANEL